MINFSAWSIHRPLPAILGFVLLMAAGFYTFEKLPITDFAISDSSTVSVSVGYSGATPSQMEVEITRKIEDAVSSITGIEHVTSSVSQGSSNTTIEFEEGTDIQIAMDDVRDAVSRVRSALPSEINEPTVSRMTISGNPVSTYAVQSDTLGQEELSWLVDDTVSKQLLAIPGVGQVNRQGGVDRQIRIDLLPDRLLAFNLTAGQISTQLRSTQGELAGGKIYFGDGEQNIRILSTVDSVDALRALPIALSDGRAIRLEEIARVEDRYDDVKSAVLLDGKPVIGIQIRRALDTNEVEIAAEVDKAIEALKVSNPTVKFTLVSSNLPRVMSTYTSSMEKLYEGALLAIVVVFLFLRDWRATWIAAVALPLSIVPTFYVMGLFNISLNTITLLAISLVVGLLVDDAIVEVENIVRHLREGKQPKQAALDAAQEIGMAVIGTSLTLVAIFVPVAMMSGISGRFFKQFAITCTVAVLFSLMVARLITPMMAAYQLKADKKTDEGHDKFLGRYLPLVKWTLINRGKTLLGALLIFVASIVAYFNLPGGFLNAEDRGEISVNITLPPGSSLAGTRKAAEQVQALLQAVPEVTQVYTNISVGSASLDAKLKPTEDRKRSQQQIQQAITPQFTQVSGARVSMGGRGFGQNMSLVLVGDDAELLNDTAAQVEEQIRTIAGIGGITSSAALVTPEIAIRPDFEKAARLGITSSTLSEAIRIGTTGDIDVRLAKLSLPTRQIPIRIQLAPEALESMDNLRLMRIPARNGSVALENVASITLSSGAAQISRYDRHRNVTINVPLNGQALTEVLAKVQAIPALQKLPPGIEQQKSGDLERQSQLSSGFKLAMLAGVFCIYGVLALLFNDLLQPITILLALPLAMGGAVLALVLGGYGLQVPSYIGLLLLMGIAVKNSILLVDYTVLGVEQGLHRHEALIDACAKRARPIIMTSIAMGAGMIPTAFDFSGTNSFRAPMGMAVLGGLITSTILSLLVIPAAYTYIDDFETWFRRLRHRFA
ncbi:MAG: efflux RND transporter permease subunit [Steroidobacteraceae bacterium]